MFTPAFTDKIVSYVIIIILIKKKKRFFSSFSQQVYSHCDQRQQF